ncbi:TetR/AcrR family transcriptional regulator [Paractinoplanes toevensis]|uniref:HTH-type transcriptional repressor n=1 Tax=Paractinoplanes toevensis TaxID=571911 RepID=A0A919W8M1_9ACTN|nr:TetR family transcriptional regulator [Actinoplanes toevensis]GIM94581.1 HTH-type transcriptional repressor [Actinoplanes toevensis]
MRTRDPETKRRLLLEAALEEFAAYGVAGARVDRLAKRAGISAGLVYSFYENKDGLFEAVFDLIVEQTVSAVPIDADDLGEYAGRLCDAGLAHPHVLRFVAWYQLERGDAAARRASTTAAMADKVAAIAQAQSRGVVTDRIPPGEILALVLTLANMWQLREPEFLDLVEPGRRRAAVVEAVRRLTAPGDPT